MRAREVALARTYDQFLSMVLRRVGDVRYTTKDSYNRVVENVLHLAQQQGTLSSAQVRSMQTRLDAAFADLRGTMSQVYDNHAPIDPHHDLPRTQT